MFMARNILLTVHIAAALIAAATADAQEGGDIQAQIEYAYQTEDINTLADVIQNLGAQVTEDTGNTALRYHLAHAHYRFGQIAHERHRGEAEAAESNCIDELKPLLGKDVKSADSLALQAACYSVLADLKSIEAVLLRSRSAERLKAALVLGPDNPRAVLLLALQDGRGAKPGSAESQRAFAELQRAAHLFEQSSATSSETPGWGHADAYLALGVALKVRGDQLGARNWIEKALIAAPDYKNAQRQLALLAK